MRNVLLILAGLVALALGVLILVLSRCASAVAIGAGSGFALLGFALAIPAQMDEAKGRVVAWACIVRDAVSAARSAP